MDDSRREPMDHGEATREAPFHGEDSYQAGTYEEGRLQENAHQENAHQENAHQENAHQENAHQENPDQEDTGQGDNGQGGTGQEDRHQEGGHQEDKYQEDKYQEDGHQDDGHQEDGYQEDGHQEDGYQEDGQQEDIDHDNTGQKEAARDRTARSDPAQNHPDLTEVAQTQTTKNEVSRKQAARKTDPRNEVTLGEDLRALGNIVNFLDAKNKLYNALTKYIDELGGTGQVNLGTATEISTASEFLDRAYVPVADDLRRWSLKPELHEHIKKIRTAMDLGLTYAEQWSRKAGDAANGRPSVDHDSTRKNHKGRSANKRRHPDIDSRNPGPVELPNRPNLETDKLQRSPSSNPRPHSSFPPFPQGPEHDKGGEHGPSTGHDPQNPPTMGLPPSNPRQQEWEHNEASGPGAASWNPDPMDSQCHPSNGTHILQDPSMPVPTPSDPGRQDWDHNENRGPGAATRNPHPISSERHSSIGIDKHQSPPKSSAAPYSSKGQGQGHRFTSSAGPTRTERNTTAAPKSNGKSRHPTADNEGNRRHTHSVDERAKDPRSATRRKQDRKEDVQRPARKKGPETNILSALLPQSKLRRR